MAASWVTSTITGYVSPIVNNAVSTAGTFAGDTVGAVGSGINGVGSAIEGSIRRYGDGTKDYGNAIKDWTKGDGVRQGTAGNPLGLSDTAGGGKRAITAPRYAPSVSQKKPEPQKALPAAGPAKKATAGASTATRAPVKPATGRSPLSGGPPMSSMSLTPRNPPGPSSGKRSISAQSRPEGARGRGKQTAADRRRAGNASSRAGGGGPAPAAAKKYQPSNMASNPLGL